MIKVINTVKVYEYAGKESCPEPPSLIVKSHWNRSDFVVLSFPSCPESTVLKCDLIAAIENAANTGGL